MEYFSATVLGVMQCMVSQNELTFFRRGGPVVSIKSGVFVENDIIVFELIRLWTSEEF